MRLRDIGEGQFLRTLRDRFGRAGEWLRVGIGDDAAVLTLPQDRQVVLSCDALVEWRHFRREWLSAPEIGARAVCCALSDLAAMGAEPLATLLTLVVSPEEDAAMIQQVVEGAAAAGARFGAPLAGGETVGYPGPLILDVTVLGAVTPGRARRRSGARPGDVVCVSGPIGESAAGLAALKNNLTGPDAAPAIARFRRPEPRIALGLLLSKLRGVHAVIDISDGLLRDAAHVAEASRVQIRLRGSDVPVSTSARDVFLQLNLDPLTTALSSGEEFELLIAVDPSRRASIARRIERECGLQLYVIGEILEGMGVIVLDADGSPVNLPCDGWDQFRSA